MKAASNLKYCKTFTALTLIFISTFLKIAGIQKDPNAYIFYTNYLFGKK